MRATLFLAALLAVTPAQAHDWYPMECCSWRDCGPVTNVEIIPAPNKEWPVPTAMVVTTKVGMAIVPFNITHGHSKDHRMHACLVPRGNGDGKQSGEWAVICIFIPPLN